MLVSHESGLESGRSKNFKAGKRTVKKFETWRSRNIKKVKVDFPDLTKYQSLKEVLKESVQNY